MAGGPGCDSQDPGDQRGCGTGSEPAHRKILKKTPMEQKDRESLLEAVDTAAGKVVNKLIFGLRDSLNQEVFLECVAGLEKLYED